MVSDLPLISIWSNPFSKPLEIILSALTTIGITITLMFYSSFSFLWQDPSIGLLFFYFFDFHFVKRQDRKIHYMTNSFFFFIIDQNKVWSSDQNKMIRSYFKIPENFMSLIFLERFWFVLVPFGCMVEFKFLAQVPVDQLSHPIMPSLILVFTPEFPLEYFDFTSLNNCKSSQASRILSNHHYYFIPSKFLLVVFHWSLSDSNLLWSPGLFSVFRPISTIL